MHGEIFISAACTVIPHLQGGEVHSVITSQYARRDAMNVNELLLHQDPEEKCPHAQMPCAGLGTPFKCNDVNHCGVVAVRMKLYNALSGFLDLMHPVFFT
eukprot:1340289-Amphidinium_carterae.5